MTSFSDQFEDARIHRTHLLERCDDGADENHLLRLVFVAEVVDKAVPHARELLRMRADDPLTLRSGHERPCLLYRRTRHLGLSSSAYPRVELGRVGSEQGEHRPETEQLLDHVRLPDELALPVETAAFVLLFGAAGAGSVARNEADAGEPRSSSGRPVRSGPGAGADA